MLEARPHRTRRCYLSGMLVLLASLAIAGDLVVLASVPAEVHLDGQVLAQLFSEAELRVPVPVGDHTLRIFRNGTPEDVRVSVGKGLDVTVAVGESGISVGEALERLAPVEGTVAVEFRIDDSEGALLLLDGERIALAPGAVVQREVPAGEVPISLRNANGTVVWAVGALHLTSGPVVVQVRPGRLPEVPSLGGRFQPKLD